MIKANEFRIGNIVQDQVSREPMIVDEIGENIGATLINREKYPLPDGWQMGPIPLTPDILEKCGFETTHEYLYHTTSGISIITDEDGYRLCEEDAHEGNIYRIGKPFHFVHQLQNLFFCLIGEELEVKL